jgi:GTPase Era involved in 16S rRNA processing
MQVLSTQLNQICALAQLRNRVSHSCLLGCVGEINAGKTSLVRALLGLPQEPTGHRLENATRCAAASAMPVPGPEGLKIIPASPLLVDTPGMFDADSNLADCAVRYLGNCLIQMHMISCSLLCLIL